MNYTKEYGLPNSLKGKSFADASKSIENTFKGRNSVFDMNTKKELMSRLKDIQEQQKQKLDQKKLQLQSNEGQLAYGGDPILEDPLNNINQNLGNQLSKMNTNQMNYVNNQPNWLQRQASPNSWLNKNEGSNSSALLGGLGLGISALAPMIANSRASKSMKQAATVNPMLVDLNTITPNFVNRQQLMRNATEQAGTQRYNMAQTGGNWGQLSQGYAGLNAAMLGSTGNLMLQSDLADSQEKIRVQQGRQGIQQFNIGQTQRAEELNAQNLAAYNSQKAAYKQATGANFGAIGQSLFNYITAKKVAQSTGNTYAYNSIDPVRRRSEQITGNE